jgi:hypothetical protein
MVITVAPWAADRAPKQIEWTPAPIHDAEEAARRDNARSPASPEPRNPAAINDSTSPSYQRYESQVGPDGIERTVAVGEPLAVNVPKVRGSIVSSMREREDRLAEGAEARRANRQSIITGE